VPHARHAASEFAGTKYLSWSENLARYERAHEQGFDEVVLLNERGEVAECTSANIFVVKGDQVSTPPLSSGCLPGVTRALLLEEIHVPGLAIAERILFTKDLEAAGRGLHYVDDARSDAGRIGGWINKWIKKSGRGIRFATVSTGVFGVYKQDVAARAREVVK